MSLYDHEPIIKEVDQQLALSSVSSAHHRSGTPQSAGQCIDSGGRESITYPQNADLSGSDGNDYQTKRRRLTSSGNWPASPVNPSELTSASGISTSVLIGTDLTSSPAMEQLGVFQTQIRSPTLAKGASSEDVAGAGLSPVRSALTPYSDQASLHHATGLDRVPSYTSASCSNFGWEQYNSPTFQAPSSLLVSEEDARLLRYFVERLARSFDLTDSERHFRLVVPQRAAKSPLLMKAILALSARHLNRIEGYDPLASDRYHNECLEHLIPLLGDSDAILNEDLLVSTIILRHLEEIEVPLTGHSPSNDGQSHLLGAHAFMEVQNPGSTPKPSKLRQAAFWVGLRQEIFVAVVNQRSVKPTLQGLDRSLESASDYTWSCRMVVLCADVIRFCFSPDDQMSSTYKTLLRAITGWHDSKPESFMPVYYREPEYPRAFPVIYFLRDEIPVGWQHYHIAKILLHAHDPKTPKIGPARAKAIRKMDDEMRSHVRQLCGICESGSNLAPNYTYAAMAVAIAGEKFQERYEQEALMEILDLGDRMHAHPTGYARDNLRASWGWDD